MGRIDLVALIDLSARLSRAMPRNPVVEELRVLVDNPVDRSVDIARAAIEAVEKRKAAQREWVRLKRAAAKASKTA